MQSVKVALHMTSLSNNDHICGPERIVDHNENLIVSQPGGFPHGREFHF